MASNPRADQSQGPLAEFTSRPLFQLAIPAIDPAGVKSFYCDLLGSRVAREDRDTLELSFFGGLLCVYRVTQMPATVEGERHGLAIPVPNFGLVMSWEDWHRAVDHLNYVGIQYQQAPARVQAADGREEMWFVLRDPGGNCLAFGTTRPVPES